MFPIVFPNIYFFCFSPPQLNTEWAQVEVIDLINDGSGLGFGIIGGRSTGVVVKTILPGGVADRVSILEAFFVTPLILSHYFGAPLLCFQINQFSLTFILYGLFCMSCPRQVCQVYVFFFFSPSN